MFKDEGIKGTGQDYWESRTVSITKLMIKAHEDFKHKARFGSAELRQITYICRLVEYYDHHDRYQQI